MKTTRDKTLGTYDPPMDDLEELCNRDKAFADPGEWLRSLLTISMKRTQEADDEEDHPPTLH